jgi:transposase
MAFGPTVDARRPAPIFAVTITDGLPDTRLISLLTRRCFTQQGQYSRPNAVLGAACVARIINRSVCWQCRSSAPLNLPITEPKMMLADKSYDGDDVRSSLLMHGILPVIPPKANRKDPIACDFKAYKDRNCIEPMFNRLKQFRRIATRYDKTPLIHQLSMPRCPQVLVAILCQHALSPARRRVSKFDGRNSTQ